MAFDEGLRAYASTGKVQPHTTAGSFTNKHFNEAGEFSGPKMDAVLRTQYPPEFAAKLIGKDSHDRVDDNPTTWDESDDPRRLDEGYFLYASEIKWDTGTLKCKYLPDSGELAEVYFPSNDHLFSDFPSVTYDVEFGGLSFEYKAVELLLPSFDLSNSLGFAFEFLEVRRNIGRPTKWDWEGAMAGVIAQAQTPDGLPTGAGAQARIEELISAWFMAEMGDSPAPSQVRQRAAKIMRTLERPETPKLA